MALIDVAEQQIPTTALQRQGKALIDRLVNGEDHKFVVQRECQSVAVLLSVPAYMELVNKVADQERELAELRKRLA